MNAEAKVEAADPLMLLRQPFKPHQISKLPKPYKKDSPKGNCPECGGYHGLPAMHLDYVGHAALTDRLLDTDPHWTWEPAGFDERGLPAIDQSGGLWIKLTVCGVTRFGYGAADGKTGGDAMKERIGDALRNAAMRFGAALDLWHKGDLHVSDNDQETSEVFDTNDPKIPGITKIRNNLNKLRRDGGKAADLEAFNALVHACKDDLQKIKDAEHSLWTGMGEDFDGFKAWIKRRREELTPKEESLGFQLLASNLAECATRGDLTDLLDKHDAAICELDGEESRKWEELYNAREAAIMALANVSVG